MTQKPAQAAFKAEFVNFKPIPSRKVLELKLEVPIEEGDNVMAILGMPNPAHSKWVSVAVLDSARASSPPADEPAGEVDCLSPSRSRSWDEMPYPQRAGIRSNENAFWEFSGTGNVEDAAQFIRDLCRVASRSEIKPGTDAAKRYDEMERNYDTWLRYERVAS